MEIRELQSQERQYQQYDALVVMPLLEDESHGVAVVGSFRKLLQTLLDRAGDTKPTTTIEPPLRKSHFSDIGAQVLGALGDIAVRVADLAAERSRKIRQYAIVETAVRDVFSDLIVSKILF